MNGMVWVLLIPDILVNYGLEFLSREEMENNDGKTQPIIDQPPKVFSVNRFPNLSGL